MLSEEDKAEARRLIELRIKDWKRTHGDLTPTKPHIPAEVVSGDAEILKLALQHAEAECVRLREERDGFARTAVEQRALLDEARELVGVLTSSVVCYKPRIDYKLGYGVPCGECRNCKAKADAKAWLARAGGENGQ